MKENKQKIKKGKKLSKPAIVLIVGLCIILIPLTVFGGILLKAQLQTGKPIFGDRFVGDLDPAITNQQMTDIENEIKQLKDVEGVTVVMTSAQLRINIDTKDTMTAKEMDLLLDDAYIIVNKKLPISTYFTSTDSKRMYDLAINAYNFIDRDDESMVYVILTKNAMMDNWEKQVLSEPLDSELASELRGENVEVEPTETPEAE